MKTWIAKSLALPALIMLIMTACSPAFAVELVDDYQKRLWCHVEGGAVDYLLPTLERVDCLTDTHAAVVEFGSNWDRALSKALYFASMTDKLPAVVLLVNQASEYHLTKLRQAAQGLDVRISMIEW